MKGIIIGAIAIGVSVMFIHFAVKHIVTQVVGRIDADKGRHELCLGTKYVLNNDTLTVIDYSLIYETFTLSNGVKVNTATVFVESK